MRTRFRRYVLHVARELLATALGGFAVGGVLAAGPYALAPLLPAFTAFPLVLTLACLAPLLARRTGHGVGELTTEKGRLFVRSGMRRHALGRPIAAHVAAGRRGASVLLTMDDGALVALDLDDAAEALALVESLGLRGRDSVVVPRTKWRRAVHVLRGSAVFFALAYYLHQVLQLIPGDKALYGLPALGFATLLGVLHLARHRGGILLRGRTLYTPTGARSFEHAAPVRVEGADVVVEPLGGPSERLEIGDLPSAWLERVAAHLRALPRPLPEPRAPEPPPAEQLAQLHAELGDDTDDAYRGAREGAKHRLRVRVADRERSPAARALALRALVRVAPEVRVDEDDPARDHLDAVAHAPSDEAALAVLEARAPEFEA